jgi:hypothetical protein
MALKKFVASTPSLHRPTDINNAYMATNPVAWVVMT